MYDEGSIRWQITTDRDCVSAQFVVSAVGCLAAAKRIPHIDGLDPFQGAWYHTGAWPHEGVDFVGLRVGVIGTGSSGIQAIPAIAQEAAHLCVFQRTPNFSVPARSGPLDPELERSIKAEQLPTGSGRVNRSRSLVSAANEVGVK